MPLTEPLGEHERHSSTGNDNYFNASRGRVIGLITAAVVAVGALGGVAGAAFDSQPIELQEGVAPGAQPGAGGGQSKSQSSGLLSGHTGVVDFAPGAPAPLARYESLANHVEFFVPRGWRVDYQKGVEAYLRDGEGSFAYITSGEVDPSTPSGSVLADNLDTLLPPDSYTQLDLGEIKEWGDDGDGGVFGTVISSSWVGYAALWVDDQGSANIVGQIHLGVRSDGKVLVTLIEHIPPEEWEATFESLFRIPYNSFSRFAGLV
jgi:hypothetical protein